MLRRPGPKPGPRMLTGFKVETPSVSTDHARPLSSKPRSPEHTGAMAGQERDVQAARSQQFTSALTRLSTLLSDIDPFSIALDPDAFSTWRSETLKLLLGVSRFVDDSQLALELRLQEEGEHVMAARRAEAEKQHEIDRLQADNERLRRASDSLSAELERLRGSVAALADTQRKQRLQLERYQQQQRLLHQAAASATGGSAPVTAVGWEGTISPASIAERRGSSASQATGVGTVSGRSSSSRGRRGPSYLEPTLTSKTRALITVTELKSATGGGDNTALGRLGRSTSAERGAFDGSVQKPSGLSLTSPQAGRRSVSPHVPLRGPITPPATGDGARFDSGQEGRRSRSSSRDSGRSRSGHLGWAPGSAASLSSSAAAPETQSPPSSSSVALSATTGTASTSSPTVLLVPGSDTRSPSYQLVYPLHAGVSAGAAAASADGSPGAAGRGASAYLSGTGAGTPPFPSAAAVAQAVRASFATTPTLQELAMAGLDDALTALSSIPPALSSPLVSSSPLQQARHDQRAPEPLRETGEPEEEEEEEQEDSDQHRLAGAQVAPVTATVVKLPASHTSPISTSSSSRPVRSPEAAAAVARANAVVEAASAAALADADALAEQTPMDEATASLLGFAPPAAATAASPSQHSSLRGEGPPLLSSPLAAPASVAQAVTSPHASASATYTGQLRGGTNVSAGVRPLTWSRYLSIKPLNGTHASSKATSSAEQLQPPQPSAAASAPVDNAISIRPAPSVFYSGGTDSAAPPLSSQFTRRQAPVVAALLHPGAPAAPSTPPQQNVALPQLLGQLQDLLSAVSAVSGGSPAAPAPAPSAISPPQSIPRPRTPPYPFVPSALTAVASGVHDAVTAALGGSSAPVQIAAPRQVPAPPTPPLPPASPSPGAVPSLQEQYGFTTGTW